MKYLIWLQSVLNVGNNRAKDILKHFGSAENIYKADYKEILSSGLFKKSELERIKDKNLTYSLEIIEDCKKNGIEIIPLGSSKYPYCLSVIEDAPLILYVKGNMPDFDKTPTISIVGPRKISDFGKKAAFSLSFRLAKSGFCIVSGGALGGDTYAHAGAIKAKGKTVIDNAAKEPHIVDVANFLNTMGADIRGAGTDIIKINGVKELKGGATYSVVPDQIEAGTFMIAAAATNGDVTIKNCIPKHMEPITAKLIETGAKVEEFEDSIRVTMNSRPKAINIKTLPYPGFPTDMQPQFATYLTKAIGSSMVVESIWESRFQYTAELIKMGAKISYHDRTAMITGMEELYGAPVKAVDLRAGAAMIIAGLIATGYTEIYDIHHIERGYENIVDKFNNLGANLAYEEIPEV